MAMLIELPIGRKYLPVTSTFIGFLVVIADEGTLSNQLMFSHSKSLIGEDFRSNFTSCGCHFRDYNPSAGKDGCITTLDDRCGLQRRA
jgi:hypothetical protein